MKLYEIFDGNRKDKMFSCIYLWTNEINGKHYVGQAQHFYNRMMVYKNRGATPKLQNAINKYGIDNFNIEILEKCDIEYLDEREQYWMDYYQSYEADKGYNIAKYASTTRGCFHTEKARKKMSESKKGKCPHLFGEKNGMYGKHHTEEELKAISEHSKKLWEDEEYRRFQSERISGDKNYFYGKHFNGELNAMYGKHHTEETKAKISKANKGNHTIGGCMAIRCIETNEVFISMSEAARKYGAYASAIKLAVDNPKRTCKGYHFEKVSK